MRSRGRGQRQHEQVGAGVARKPGGLGGEARSHGAGRLAGHAREHDAQHEREPLLVAGERGESRDAHGALGLRGDVGAHGDTEQRGGCADPPRRAGRERGVEAHGERLARCLREVGGKPGPAGEAPAGGGIGGIGGSEADAGEVRRERVECGAAHGRRRPAEEPERDDPSRTGELREPAPAARDREVGDHRATRTLAMTRDTSAGCGT